MPYYQVFNASYTNAIQFTSTYDYNMKECLTIPPRSSVGGEADLLGEYPTSVEYGRTRLINEIFDYAEANPDVLEITKDGLKITRADYKQDFS